MTFEYSKKVMQHFMHPKNVGKIKNPDGIGKIGNPICGDVMWIYIKVEKKEIKNKQIEYIKNIKFQTFGCAAAISTSSMITELAKGKTIEQAKKITIDDVVSALKGLPPIKMHCSNLAADALHEAIKDYERKKRKNEN